MKRGPNDTLPVKQILIITQSLEELLQEVNNAHYENFQDYLLQNQTSHLDLSHKARGINLHHLGCALQGSAVITLGLASNAIDDQGAESLGIALQDTAVTTLDLADNIIGPRGTEQFGNALKGTAVTTLNLGLNIIDADGAAKLGNALKGTAVNTLNLMFNNIGDVGTEKLGKALKGTAVTTLNVGFNNMGADGAEKLGKSLQGTAVTDLDLTGNDLGADGAEKLGKALQGTAVTALGLECNNFGANGAAALAACIPDTLIMKVRLNFEYEASLPQALALNERKLIQTPYTATCLTHLPENEKNKYYNLPTLGNNPSKEKEITFAGGILAALGTYKPELQAQIISYLPFMNYLSAQKLQALAQTHHGKGLQIEGEPHINSKPKC